MKEETYKSDCVIIKHDAKKAGLHYDLRIAIEDNVYFSFRLKYDATKELSVPYAKGKIVAIRTTDHTKKEAYFTGTIPEGEYGAGTLKKYVSSQIELRTDKKSKMVFHHTSGKYKNETWVLIKMSDTIWMLFKTRLK
jgi:bifunctional non-homologous end joining protein LigD